MSDFLTAMAAASRLRAEAVRREPGEAELTSRASSGRPALGLEVADEGFDLIAEAKLASPSEGRLTADGDDARTVLDLSTDLEGAGAAALSVLTEPARFAGDIAHLETVAGVARIPVMRKDFLVDPIQVLEARAAGASGVLLIARIVDPALLVEMTDLAIELGMFALVELFDEADIRPASRVFDREILVGVNARDLTSLQVDRQRHGVMAGTLPGHLPLVAESGIFDAEDARRVAALGYRLALVGTSLVSSPDPGELASEMIAAGRSAVGVRGRT
jgi:indole-3-glycerol phosphate synthase